MTYTKPVLDSSIKASLSRLKTLNNWRGPLAILEDYGVIALAIGLAHYNAWFYPLSIVMIGSRQRALASLLHEAAHLTLTKNRRLNHFLGKWLAGYPILQAFETYRRSHVMMHHGHLGNPEKDPDYVNYIENGLYQVRDRLDFMYPFLLKTIFLVNVPKYLHYLLSNRFGLFRENPREVSAIIACQLIIAVSFSVIISPWAYVLFWVIPYITAFQVIGWLSEIAEHYPLFKPGNSYYEITRNRFAGRVERLFIGMHSDNLYMTHHVMASISFWNLKKAHRILMADPDYRQANELSGGIFTAVPGKISVIRDILNQTV